MPQLKMFRNFWLSSILFLLVIFNLILPLEVLASTAFDPNEIISDRVLHGVTGRFSSASLIQSYLESQGSVLAKIQVPVSFEPDSAILNPDLYQNKPYYLNPAVNTSKYADKLVSPAEIIWELAQGDLGNGCSTYWTDLCYNNRLEPINPGFILAKIQKEQGLVYGTWARKSPTDPEVQFRLDRALGFYCNGLGKSRSCYDENPSWKYYDGFFRQLYFGIRILRIREETCRLGEPFAFRNVRGVHKVGATINIRNRTSDTTTSAITFKTGMACSLYIFTPYVSAQDLLFRVIRSFDLEKNLLPNVVVAKPEFDIQKPVVSTNKQNSPESEKNVLPEDKTSLEEIISKHETSPEAMDTDSSNSIEAELDTNSDTPNSEIESDSNHNSTTDSNNPNQNPTTTKRIEIEIIKPPQYPHSRAGMKLIQAKNQELLKELS